jgi:hypothetical protein
MSKYGWSLCACSPESVDLLGNVSSGDNFGGSSARGIFCIKAFWLIFARAGIGSSDLIAVSSNSVVLVAQLSAS